MLTLSPIPVRLRGRVVASTNPDQGIAADLKVTTPDGISTKTTAHDDGRFEFKDPLPLLRAVGIIVTATGYELEQFEYEPNYNQPVNSLLIRLSKT